MTSCRDLVERALSLCEAMIANDPNEPVSDAGHTCLDLWKHEISNIRSALSQPHAGVEEAVEAAELSDKELTDRLQSLAIEIFSSANKWAINDGVRRILRLMEIVNPEEYSALHQSLYPLRRVASFDDGQPSEQQEWNGYDPDC